MNFDSNVSEEWIKRQIADDELQIRQMLDGAKTTPQEQSTEELTSVGGQEPQGPQGE